MTELSPAQKSVLGVIVQNYRGGLVLRAGTVLPKHVSRVVNNLRRQALVAAEAYRPTAAGVAALDGGLPRRPVRRPRLPEAQEAIKSRGRAGHHAPAGAEAHGGDGAPTEERPLSPTSPPPTRPTDAELSRQALSRAAERQRIEALRPAMSATMAQLELQRKGRIVYRSSVHGGPKGHWVVSGMGKEVPEADLIAEAERVLERDKA